MQIILLRGDSDGPYICGVPQIEQSRERSHGQFLIVSKFILLPPPGVADRERVKCQTGNFEVCWHLQVFHARLIRNNH